MEQPLSTGGLGVGAILESAQSGLYGVVAFGILYSLAYNLVGYLVNLYRLRHLGKVQDLKGKHVMVTGGSSGIGKAVAVAVARRGAHVSILARNAQKLSETATEIKAEVGSSSDGERVRVFEKSVDLSAGYEVVDKAVQETVAKMGPVYMLVNCAGFAICRKFENLSVDDEQQMMSLNYFGSIWTTRSVLPSMKESGRGGVLVFVASQGGLVGVYGMTSYCASKFAVRGFAEALAMEVSPYNISVSVTCPPDTETPGLVSESVGKPEETRLISEYGGLFSAKEVADQLVLDALNTASAGKGEGSYSLGSKGLDGWIAVRLCNGFANSSFALVLMETFVLGPARFISWIYTRQFYAIIRKCHRKRNVDKKTE